MIMHEPLIGTIVKNGTSLGVTIPREVLTAYHIERGDRVVFICDDHAAFKIHRINPETWRKYYGDS